MSERNPLIVQSDLSLLLALDSPRYEAARNALLGFAELEKSPEHVHTYRISPLSIWNACAAGVAVEEMLAALDEYARYPVPELVSQTIRDHASRYGRVRITGRAGDALRMEVDSVQLAQLLERDRAVAKLVDRDGDRSFRLDRSCRGRLKVALMEVGFPAEDLAGYTAGAPLAIELRETTVNSAPFTLRSYQSDAVAAFYESGGPRGGSGVVVLPCGAGKTIVAIGAMAAVGARTLILTTSTTAVRQWIDELLDKTHLNTSQVGEYTGDQKQLRPVTVSTYQLLTSRPARDAPFRHMALFDRQDWGLIVYDEVHLLPAPVFQATAGVQARRRLGLTATLVREDNREHEVFALIGPKKASVPWKELERQGWVAKASCTEIRVALSDRRSEEYSLAERRYRFRIAAENPRKTRLVRQLLERHRGEPTLVMAMYLRQIRAVAKELDLPLLTGKTPQAERDRLYAEFRSGRLPVLAVSKVANFAVDLPDAAVAIQISGTFGSRQEEAQRLGRLLRPKAGSNQAHFYTLVSSDTRELEFALNRQRFLCEQGYGYRLRDEDEIDEPDCSTGATSTGAAQ